MMPEPKIVQVAGGVVVRSDNKIAVVHTDGNSWSFPKGHVEDGETLLEAAMREIEEETGLTNVVVEKELGRYTRCKIGKGGQGEDCSEIKEITFFHFMTEETEANPKEARHKEVRFLEKDEVSELLTHPKDKQFFLSIKKDIP